MVYFDILIIIVWPNIRPWLSRDYRTTASGSSRRHQRVVRWSSPADRARDQGGDRFAHRLDCLFKGADGSKVDRRGLVVRAKITCRDHFVARAVREAL